MQQGPRVAVIGLDCGTPQLLFRDLIDEIPNIRKLMDGGMHGDLASITPPITVPAWACAMTGKTPGQLGLYGFRNRKDHTYDGLSIATSGSIHEPAVWDKLAEKGMRSLLIGVPPSFPPPKEFPGWRIGCFLTPPSAKRFAFPEELEVEVAEELGGPGNYIFDIPNFREQGMQFVLDQVFAMTERRFKVARRLVKNKPWDYFMMVEMGPTGSITSSGSTSIRAIPCTWRATSSRPRSRTTTASWTVRSVRSWRSCRTTPSRS